MTQPTTPDLILFNGRFTTLDRSNPHAEAVAIKDGKFTAVGRANEVMALAGPNTKIIDLHGKRVLPGLIDNHCHIIRGGLNFNLELRWDGVRSLADVAALALQGVAGVILGRSLLQGEFTMAEALATTTKADASC